MAALNWIEPPKNEDGKKTAVVAVATPVPDTKKMTDSAKVKLQPILKVVFHLNQDKEL